MIDDTALLEIENWLRRASAAPPADEILAIRRHLTMLAATEPTRERRHALVDAFYNRAGGVIDALLPRLVNVRLPVSLHTRQTVRSMQESLAGLARLQLDQVELPPGRLTFAPVVPTEVALWRIVDGLARCLMLANLVAAPPPHGVWRDLHRAYIAARRHGVTGAVREGRDTRTMYARALVAGALPGSALNAQEWACFYGFLADSSTPLEVADHAFDTPEGPSLWASPDFDGPPNLLDRRPPSEGVLAFHVPLAGILGEIKETLARRVQGETPPEANTAEARISLIVLRRVRDYLKAPRKRRFPRRRQGYRSTLCVGFDEVWTLLDGRDDPSESLSEWMVTNESPGGYAAMHLSGRPGKARVGDLVAFRRDDDETWRVCIVRWALSENPEHLEFGLEEISPQAKPGRIGAPTLPDDQRARALWLPALPPLRASDALACAPASAPDRKATQQFTPTASPENPVAFAIQRPLEQSSSIDIYLVAPSGDRAA